MQVVEVHLVKLYPPLVEAQHPGLLIRNSPAPGDILYPQRLDPVKTEELLRLLGGVKGPKEPSNVASTNGLPTVAAGSTMFPGSLSPVRAFMTKTPLIQ